MLRNTLIGGSILVGIGFFYSRWRQEPTPTKKKKSIAQSSIKVIEKFIADEHECAVLRDEVSSGHGKPIRHIVLNTLPENLSFRFKQRTHDLGTEKDCGYFGMVMRGYKTENKLSPSSEPDFAIKQLHDRCTPERTQYKANLAKEVICHRVLGRASYSFMVGDQGFILYDWQAGMRFDEYAYTQSTMNEFQMLRALKSVLLQLQALHRELIAHGDVAADNLIIDLDSYGLSLIDFGSAVLDCKDKPAALKSDIERLNHVCDFLAKHLNADINAEALQLITKLQHQLPSAPDIDSAIQMCDQVEVELQSVSSSKFKRVRFLV